MQKNNTLLKSTINNAKKTDLAQKLNRKSLTLTDLFAGFITIKPLLMSCKNKLPASS